MKIRFKKKRLYTNLIIGLIWTVLAIITILVNNKIRSIHHLYLIIGILYLLNYLFELTNQYLTIENGIIQKSGLFGFGKKVNLNEIIWIKKFAGDYILKTANTKLIINTQCMEEKSLDKLNSILTNLNVKAYGFEPRCK